MPNEIYHRSNWGNANAEGFGDVYFDAAATNKLYNHSDYYENSDGTDKILKDLSNKASIVLTPTAYSDGSLNTVIPPYQVLPTELVTNGTFDTDLSGWVVLNSDATHTVTHTSDGARFQSDTTSPIMYFQTIDTILQGGKKYSLTVEIVNKNSGSVKIQGNNINLFYSDNGVFTDVIEPTGDGKIFFLRAVANVDLTIKSVSVKEVQEADFDFSRGSSATRVNEKGLIEDVQILSGELVQNGDFEQIGSELVTNGSFDTDSDWVKPVGLSISNGVASANNVSSGQQLWQSFTSIGIYKVEFTISNYTIGGVKPIFHGATYTGASSATANGKYIQYVKVTSTPSRFSFQFQSTTTLDIDNVSVKEVGQNWTFGTGWNIEDGKVVADGTMTSSDTLKQGYNFTDGNKYRFKFTISDYQSGSVYIREPFNGSADAVSANGTYTFDYIAGAGNEIRFRSDNGFTGSIDDVSFKEVTDDTDLPRIDYTDGEGSLLLEPQRTNLITYSEDLTQTTWSAFNSTLVNSNIINPEGASGASLYVCNNYTGSNQYFRINPNTTYSNDVDYTYSMFVKYNTFQFCKLSYINFNGAEHFTSVFDIINGTVTATDSDGTPQNTNANIQDFGNGWFRISISAAITSSSGNAMNFEFNKCPSGTPTFAVFGRTDQTTTTNDKIYVYGAQLEQGSYATSYIPTSGSTVTRSADVANNSGNADLFNDSEGVLYAEIAALANDGNYKAIALSDGTTSNQVLLALGNSNNTITWEIRSSGLTSVFTSYSANVLEINKIAIKYKANDFALWLNGSEVMVDANGNAPTGLNVLDFERGDGALGFYGNVKCVAVFKEALTDAELESLTSWISFTEMATDLEYTLE